MDWSNFWLERKVYLNISNISFELLSNIICYVKDIASIFDYKIFRCKFEIIKNWTKKKKQKESLSNFLKKSLNFEVVKTKQNNGFYNRYHI